MPGIWGCQYISLKTARVQLLSMVKVQVTGSGSHHQDAIIRLGTAEFSWSKRLYPILIFGRTMTIRKEVDHASKANRDLRGIEWILDGKFPFLEYDIPLLTP